MTLDSDIATVDELLAGLAAGESIDATRWPASGVTPEECGLQGFAWPLQPDLLDLDRLRVALGPETQRAFVTDSTNSQLLRQLDPPGTRVFTAEYQAGGRGRRSRQWISPFARSLSISIEHHSKRPLTDLGGLSTVVGVQLVTALRALGASNVGLKWPNDVLSDGNKLCGILVELDRRASDVAAVIGIGVNVDLTDREIEGVEQAVTDLRRLGVDARRTDLVIAIVTAVRAGLDRFEVRGFAPFVAAFDAVDVYRGRTCVVVSGDDRTVGKVLGIAPDGALRLETDAGVRAFYGGEVSLRRV